MVKKILHGLLGVLKKIRIKYIIIAVVLIAALGAAYIFYFQKLLSTSKTSAVLQFATVRKGDISVTVSGSGPIETANSLNITPKVNGTVTKVFFKQGDKVKKGDLMYELDDSDAMLNVENIKNQIEQTKLTQNNNNKSLNGLKVVAPFSGVVSNINVSEGDNLQKSSPILTITDQSKLKMTVPFNGIDANEIKTGMKADVYLQNVMQAIEGTVTAVSSNGYSSATGAQQFNVEITIKKSGILMNGMKAGAELNTSAGTITSSDVGTFEYVKSTVVKSDVNGTIEKLNVIENQYIKSGTELMKIANDDLAMSLQTTNLKLKDLQSQLNQANKQVGNCRIYSDIDGVIVSQTATAGTVVKSGETLATVSDSNHMQFEISIDELDIAKIKTGQTASISVDALTETTAAPLSGVVSEIALEGTPSNGVTTYPVTIKINDSKNLKVGMNANAEILVNQKKDVLYVPLQAIHTMGDRSYVLLKSNVTGNGAGQGGLGGYGPGNFNGRMPDMPNQGGSSSNKNGGTADQSSGQTADSRNPSGRSGNNDNGYSGNNRNSDNNDSNQNDKNRGNYGPPSGNGNGYSGYGRNGGNGGYDRNSGNGPSNRMRSMNGNSGDSETVMKFVEVGINNENYIEIKSGLNEGDQVALPVVTTSSSKNNGNNAGGMMLGGLSGGGGGFGGGFSGGGFSGGGGFPGRSGSSNRNRSN